MYGPGAKLCFPPPQCTWATHRHLPSGCPGAQECTLVARVIGEEAAAGVVRSPNPVGVLLVPGQEGLA